jgi:uncharacterized protein YegL
MITLNDLVQTFFSATSTPGHQESPMSTALINAQDDLIDNPTPRCACQVVLDTSASMRGAPIEQLNRGFRTFLDTLHDDPVARYAVEVGAITAGGHVNTILPITSVRHVEQCATFLAGGMTPLGSAVELALNELEARKQHYKDAGVPYYQPWLVIISDGAPNDAWQAIAARARQQSQNKQLVVMPVGVEDADLSILGQFSHRPALKLQGLAFGELFTWLSASMASVSRSASTADEVELPAMNGWASI